MFTIGSRYSLDEMRDRIGKFQLQQVFPQIGSDIVCGLFNMTSNRNAPGEILIGVGPQMTAKANKLAAEGTIFPVFIDQKSNLWEFRGRYHVTRILKQGDLGFIQIWRESRRPDPPGTVLNLEQVEDDKDERSVRRYFTHYWNKDAWENARSSGEEGIPYAFSNQFRKRGVAPGDYIYVLTVIAGDLFLGGRMEVGQILDQAEAERRRGEKLSDGADHAFALKDSHTKMMFDRKVPKHVVRKLVSVTEGKKSVLVFGEDGKLDQQTLRVVRELTLGSAQLLDEFIIPSLGRGNSQAGESKPRTVNIDFLNLDEIIVEPPTPRYAAEEVVKERSYDGKIIDHAARDAANRELGCRGEEFVVEYERRALVDAGKPKLASKVRHVSVTEGDGAGYDVLSFESSGREKYIEVKTTRGRKTTPFIVSLNEVEFSDGHQDNYCLYRVFDFSDELGKMYIIRGSLKSNLVLEAIQFKASFET